MKRILWNKEEAVALFDLFFRYDGQISKIPEHEISYLTTCYLKRAEKLNIKYDDKFRNSNGLHIQLSCILYVVTEGKLGNPHTSKLFYQIYSLYQSDRNKFNSILSGFYKKYSS